MPKFVVRDPWSKPEQLKKRQRPSQAGFAWRARANHQGFVVPVLPIPDGLGLWHLVAKDHPS